MNLWKCVGSVLLSFAFIATAIASPIGTWTTIDDKTGKKRAVVRVSESGGVLSGTIVKIYKQAGDTGVCSKCPGKFKGKPIEGLRFMWGLKKSGNNVWSGGRILDPKSGRVYNVKITEKGNKLFVRGFFGLSMLGRTQVWVK